MLDRLRGEDEGFTLVETLAAMMLFAVLAVSVAGVLLNNFDVTKRNASRVTAANLAATWIEAARAAGPAGVQDGLTVEVTAPVNGVPYTVSQTANYVAADASTSLCTGTATATGVRLAYKLVTVSVAWPSMGTTKPVRQDTLLNVGLDGVDPTKGTAAIGVTGADGQPVSGVIVTLAPVGLKLVTGGDGCAIFPGLDPAVSYSAVLDQDGYVTRSGQRQAVSTAFKVEAKGVQRVPMEYAPAGGLAMTLTGPEGLLPPATLGVTLSNSGLTPTDRPFEQCTSTSAYGCVSGSPRTAARLWPGDYAARPGTCADGLTATAVTRSVVAGSTSQAVLALAGARVEVRTAPTVKEPNGTPLTGYTVHARHPADTACAAQSWPMAPAGASSQSLALPTGKWTFVVLKADGTTASSPDPWPTATLSVGGPVPTLVIYVKR